MLSSQLRQPNLHNGHGTAGTTAGIWRASAERGMEGAALDGSKAPGSERDVETGGEAPQRGVADDGRKSL